MVVRLGKELVIHIDNSPPSPTQSANRKIPPGMDAIKDFLPTIKTHNENTLTASHLVIPIGKEKTAVKQALNLLITSLLGGKIKAKKLNTLTNEAEKQIISKNKKHYQKWKNLLNTRNNSDLSPDMLNSLKELADLQYAMICSYEKNST
jgi:hypothetical protein